MRFFLFVSFVFASLSVWCEAQPLLNLAPDPSFENTTVIDGWRPIGVANSIEDALQIDGEIAHSGNKSLRVKAASGDVQDGTEFYSSYNAGEGVRRKSGRGTYGARTIAYRLDRDVESFCASAWIHADAEDEIALQVRWFDRFGRRRPVELVSTEGEFDIEATSGAWKKYTIHAKRPNGAHQAQFVILSQQSKPFFVDDAHVELPRREGAMVLVNQVGYEPQSQAKFALFQNNLQSQPAPTRYAIINLKTQDIAFEGEWIALGYHQTFDRVYFKAEFNGLSKPGEYVIESRIGDMRFYSDPFEIRDGVIFDHAVRDAYGFFCDQRCGMAIPGVHAACHLDDAKLPDGSHRDLAGGWHDAGDYNKYNGYTPESFHALIVAYDLDPGNYNQFDRDADGMCDLLDEARWGADFLLKCLDRETWKIIGAVSTGYRYWGKPKDETDNQPDTRDDRPVTDWNGSTQYLISSFALLSKFAPKPNAYLETAVELYQAKGGTLLDEMALYQATGETKYQESYMRRASEFCETDASGLAQFRALAQVCLAHPKHELSARIKEIAALKLEQLQQQCDPVFGIHQRGAQNGGRIYFRDYAKINDWYVGESREMLDLAYDGLLLDALGFDEGRAIAEQQLNWVFGMNPFGVSLMQGVGDHFVPQQHHRYNTLPAISNGAVTGAVLNGIVRAWPWTDRPWIDMNPVPTGEYQCNEPWLPHNNRMLYVLSRIKSKTE
ncbi:glycoside hydrolase family 9 protein [bacterium]|nr:glycoside hydrolase family 9 protein [bacterium]